MTDTLARPIRGYRLEPIYDPAPGTLCNSGTTQCMASGEHLLGTMIDGDVLSPRIVEALRANSTARIILDAELVNAAVDFLRMPSLAKITVDGRRLSARDVADLLSEQTEDTNAD